MSHTQPLLSSKDDIKPKLPRLGKTAPSPPPIASPRSSSEKVIYVSHNSQFIAIVKRVRKYLDGAEFRAGPTVLPSTDRELMREIEEGIKHSRMGKKAGGGKSEEVVMKGTGKAIEKTLMLANWWQQQEGVRVVIRTKSVAAVDDIVGIDNADEDMGEGESRVRRVSVLEVAVSYI